MENPEDSQASQKKAHVMEYEHIKRQLHNVIDERDQLRVMIEDIRSQFTAETRLREYLDKMRSAVVKVLSNEMEDAEVRVHESLKILSSLSKPLEETLQTTGDFLTDLSYSDQETIYGSIPTSAQRKQVLRDVLSNDTNSKAIRPTPSHSKEQRKNLLHPGSSKLPHLMSRRPSKVGDGPSFQNACSSRFKNNHMGDETFVTKTPRTNHSLNVKTIGTCNVEAETTKLRTPKPTPDKYFQGSSIKPASTSEVQLHSTPRNKPTKHKFVLWLGINPETCEFCKERVYSGEFVRRCMFCGLMVHINRCEFVGECSDGSYQPAQPEINISHLSEREPEVH